MKKEMLCICRIEGDTLYYGKFYEVSELGKAKREATRLMKKTGDDYRIYICAVNIDGLFQGIAQIGGHWEMTWANGWKYFNTPKYQDAYVGMEVEVKIMTTTNINGTIQFGKIIDRENLAVELESGEVVYYNNNPWEKDNPDKRYFSFLCDIYPVPETYRIEYEGWQEQGNHIFDRKSNTEYYNSYAAADRAYKNTYIDYCGRIGKSAYGKNTVQDNDGAVRGFEYREENNEGVVLVDRYSILANYHISNRF